jgi:hypothetical protein
MKDYSKAQNPLYSAYPYLMQKKSTKLFEKKIDHWLPLFGKVVLEPTYNLEMNE